MERFQPEPEQVAAFARWLKYPEIIKMLVLQMPLCGGPRSACEERIKDVSDALLRACYGDQY